MARSRGVGAVLGWAFTHALLLAAAVLAASYVPAARQAVPQLGAVHAAAVEAWALLAPGGAWHPAAFIEHKGHLVVEASLLVVISFLLLQGTFRPSKDEEEPLTEREIDELCDEWEPEPLYPPVSAAQTGWKEPVISSQAGTQVVVNGKTALDMCSLNFLGIAGSGEIREACRGTIEKYGVGSCGPRGFYGTIDVHLQLEERLARFMGSEEAILYSYDLATLPSIIPAFASKKDLILCDEGVNYGIQNGANLSRAKVLYFKHNDLQDLERLLKQQEAADRRHRKPLNRRFIVVEGIYANTGELAPLDGIKELKERYKYRLIVDESVALGVLGPRGRGAAEHFGCAAEDVEIVGGSMGNSLASIGGFCAGDREIVDHQRLSGLGYCFSASLPPFLATAGICALDVLESRGSELIPRVQENARKFRKLAAAIPQLAVVGGEADEVSPLVHLQLHPTPPPEQYAAGDEKLQALIDDCLAREGVLLALARYSKLERARPPPSLRVAITAAHTHADLQKAVAAIKASAKRVLG
ncbi:long chain base biosynthesis 1-like [Chlorella sorokiniana]|uniref:serine C-palmitoyltransferase n=1 Tax=Chlorella sorokiniana TaxID=3076 RepID=A0A2P6TED2_CHLSO|nr:long chain base biosynthesis 1-like [Chlorella sorokiniana]|eukprot:PRW20998.1 long chain base biosynthesis 1-like [Chlorella sorokiniana]